MTRSARAMMSAGCAGVLAGCGPFPMTGGERDYANITDATNGGAAFVGSASCVQCHADVAGKHSRTAHANAMTPVLRSDGPGFEFGGPGIVEPPAGLSWNSVSWLVGGYRRGARLFGLDAFYLTTGRLGVATQYNLATPVNGTSAGYVAFEAANSEPLAFEFSAFRHFVTGPVARTAEAPESFEGRVGFAGTWSEAGVSCEACHGPGGGHFSADGPNVRIDRAAIFVDPDGTATCGTCHSNNFDPTVRTLATVDGFVAPLQQATELRASGGHASFSCGICHSSHDPLTLDRGAAIRNDCRACHADVNMALHDGAVFTRGDGYVEPLTCESCHMSYGVKQYSSGDFGLGRVGDTRTHIFRISRQPQTFADAVDSEGNFQLDAAGRAAMTVDRVCLRCHNTAVDGLFSLSVARAAEIAPNLHLDFGP